MKQIPLTQNQFALVDDQDYEYLNQWKWYAKKHGKTYYAVRGQWDGSKVYNIKMHRIIINAVDGGIIDHKDRNGLNNQRLNIRLCTHSENMRNKRPSGISKYLGVHFDKSKNRWRATIYLNKKNVSLGRFKNETDAAIAYNNSAKLNYGEFANLNKI